MCQIGLFSTQLVEVLRKCFLKRLRKNDVHEIAEHAEWENPEEEKSMRIGNQASSHRFLLYRCLPGQSALLKSSRLFFSSFLLKFAHFLSGHISLPRERVVVVLRTNFEQQHTYHFSRRTNKAHARSRSWPALLGVSGERLLQHPWCTHY